MKWHKVAAIVLSAGCIGFAGWRLHRWRAEQQAEAAPWMPPRPAASPAARAGAQLAPLPPLRTPASFYLTSLPRRPVPAMTDEDWARAYPAFRHAPFDKSGFSAVALPWRFAATPDAGAGGPEVAHAFALLLSYDLDWSPASFAATHAYTLFQQSRDWLEKPDEAYDPEHVAELVKSWGGTHAVGGLLVRGKDGYVATLQVYGADGKPVHEASFEKPQDVFALLGDVSCDALKFFGTPANDALAAHLHRKRCEQPETLATLGKAALEEAGSQAAFDLYDKVLARDPGFVEARLWRAHEHWHATGDDDDHASTLSAALSASVHVDALLNYEPPEDSDKAMAAALPQWIDRAEALAGKDHPAVLLGRLRQAGQRVIADRLRPGRARLDVRFDLALDRDAFRPIVEAAARHPNHRRLLLELAAAQYGGDSIDAPEVVLAPFDPELVASVSLASAFNRSPAPEGHGYEWYRVAEAARALGRPEHVLAALDRLRDEPPTNFSRIDGAFWAAEARMELCEFEKAAREFTGLVAWAGADHLRGRAAGRAAVCAVLAGKGEVIEQLAADPAANAGGGELFAACRKYLAGGPFDQSDFRSSYNWLYDDVLIAEAELAQGGDFARADRPKAWARWLSDFPTTDWRLQWLLLDRLYRLQPTLPHAAGFYEAAEWQHGDDPLVARAVAEWRKSGGDRSLPAADQVIANLGKKSWSGWEKQPTWTAVARVRRDLEEGRTGDAFRVLAAFFKHEHGHRILHAWMARRVEQAAAASAAKAGADSRPVQ